MWGSSRNTGALMVAKVLPTYSTPYYGTSGMDGVTTTVYEWAPFEAQSNNTTWKKTFYDQDNSLIGPYIGQSGRMGYEPKPDNGNSALFRDDSVLNSAGNPSNWIDRLPYTSWNQMGKNIGWYCWLMSVAGYDMVTGRAELNDFLDAISSGNLYPGKTTGSETMNDTVRRNYIMLSNSRFPTVAANSAAWSQGLAGSDDESESSRITSTGLVAAFMYSDVYYGGAASAKPTCSHRGRVWEQTLSVTLSTETENSTVYYTVDGSAPSNASTEYSGPIAVNSTTRIRAIAQTVGGDPSPEFDETFTIDLSGLPSPPIDLVISY